MSVPLSAPAVEPNGRDRAAAPPARAWLRAGAVAVLAYLAVGLFALRAVVPHPADSLPVPTALAALKGNWLALSQNDQILTASLLTRHARQWVRAPWALFENGQCYPTPHATALGEHMFGMGLVGVVPYALTRDPVLTTNLVLLARFVMAGMAMYALVAYWTGSAAAALVAGLVFAFQPTRLMNVIHPYIEANEWTVVALLFAHRLFTRRTWLDAAALTLAICLQLLESFYPVLALAILGGTYGLYLFVRERRAWRTLGPKLVVVMACAALVAAAIFVPYLRMKELWNALGGRATLLMQLDDFGYGGGAYAGTVTVGLAVIALIDRWRRRRDERGYDPRFVYLGAGLLVVAASVYSIPLPFGFALPSLFTVVASIVPGLDAVRGAGAMGRASALVLCFLAGYGVLALVEARSHRAQIAIALALAAAALAEVFVPALATQSFGAPVTMAPHSVRPAPELRALYERLPAGAVLDVPFTLDGRGLLQQMPHYVFLAAYHGHPVAACYNSFILQVQHDIAALATRIAERPTIDALGALGFGSVVVHDEIVGRDRRFAQLTGAAPPDPARTGLTRLDQAGGHTAFAIAAPPPVTTSWAALAADQPSSVATIRAPSATLTFTFRNVAAETFRHPDPIEPTMLLVRWYAAPATVVREDRRRELLPLALAPGATVLRTLTLPVPVDAGEYDVTLAPAAYPESVVARHHVRVVAAEAPGQ